VKLDAAHYGEILADFDVAIRGFLSPLEHDLALWTRARPGHWSAGQHAEHVAIVLAYTAISLEDALARLRAQSLPGRPWRDPLQALWVAVAVERGMLPRGGKTPKGLEATPSPDRALVLTGILQQAARYHAIGQALDATERERLWIPNPFVTFGWHYTFTEMLRVQAVHTRHHGKQIEELRAGS
jgi:hypothetical protein